MIPGSFDAGEPLDLAGLGIVGLVRRCAAWCRRLLRAVAGW